MPSTDGLSNTNTVAKYPFDDLEGDVILRSNDGISFFIHKAVLRLASPFFKAMFTLPTEATAMQEKLEISLVFQSKKIARSYMSFFHDKYDMAGVIQHIRAYQEFIEQHCIRVYAVAVRYNFKMLVRMAAKATLKLPVDQFTPVPEFSQITGAAVFNLYAYLSSARTLRKR
ncbi:hypothetical protein CPB84DRAFT_1846294 [Gymnopilus junonius]|uniref:BTB domain-containing protein n=1 Tax=Gymnopilus junonius TaxID=109634 RepID=A0A9P5NMI8_GYMJU|nr:hypothetical protein CPB84DRAFT_1846294 [Gymnopilus junonius]